MGAVVFHGFQYPDNCTFCQSNKSNRIPAPDQHFFSFAQYLFARQGDLVVIVNEEKWTLGYMCVLILTYTARAE